MFCWVLLQERVPLLVVVDLRLHSAVSCSTAGRASLLAVVDLRLHSVVFSATAGRASLVSVVELRLHSVVSCVTAETCTTTGCCGSQAAQCCVVSHCRNVHHYWLLWI